MRVAFITPYRTGAGGVESVNLQLEKLLIADGHQVDFITWLKIPRFWRLWLPAIIRPVFMSLMFSRQSTNYDLVLCNGEFGFGINHPKCIDLIHGSCHGLRQYLRGHTSWLDDFVLRLKAWQLAYGARGKYVVAVSEFTKSILAQQGVRVNRVINNSVDINQFAPANSQRHASPYLFVGYYSYYAKGFDILNKLAARGLRINCVTNRNPGQQVTWIRNVDNSQMPDIYHQHSILIFPSRYEGLQMAPLEAMACGLPVVMSNVGLGFQLRKYIPEFVIDGWDNGAVDDYVARIRQIESNYEKYSQRAREYVVTHHNIEYFYKQWREVFYTI